MFSRIRLPRGLPSIRRPRAIAAGLTVALALSASSAFAQRGGAGCAGMSGGTGGTTGSSAGGFGVAGGFGAAGNGQFNPLAMASSTQPAQPMQGWQGMFLIPAAADEVNLDGNHQQQLAARKAIRAAQLEERRAQRQVFRPEKTSRIVTTRTRPTTGR